MPNPIEFYFDFSSPYGYIAATSISALAARHGRGVEWKPMLLGAVFKVTGSGPLPSLPLKGDYALRDMPRTARFHGVPFKMPEPFPDRNAGARRAPSAGCRSGRQRRSRRQCWRCTALTSWTARTSPAPRRRPRS